ncbi:MAG TPA: restriction endonuclease [Thermoanaerobaculia bacterium]
MNDLLAAIDQLERHLPPSPQEAERLMGDLLEAILGEDGYEVHAVGWSGDRGIDYVAHRNADDGHAANSVGMQFKYRRSPSSVSEVRNLLGAAVLTRFDRAVLLASAGFTRSQMGLRRDQSADARQLFANRIRRFLTILTPPPFRVLDLPIGKLADFYAQRRVTITGEAARSRFRTVPSALVRTERWSAEACVPSPHPPRKFHRPRAGGPLRSIPLGTRCPAIRHDHR